MQGKSCLSSYAKVILYLMVDDFSDTELPDVFINK